MSDRMSVSSGTTGVASNPPSHLPYQNYNYNTDSNPGTAAHTVHQQHQQQPQNYYNPPTYFYPSSHIHNQPLLAPHPLSHHPHMPTPYMSSPAPPPPVQTSPSLTATLLASSSHQLTLATEHPFLRLAGQGQLPVATLSRWLSQDRLYAQSYIGFIGSLIARVDLPNTYVADKSTSLRWRLVQCLTSALQNIHTELAFFATTAATYGLDLEAPSRGHMFAPDPATKQYMDLFRAFWTDPSMSLLEGMVVLWATETVYLRAWTYARSFSNEVTSSSGLRQQQRIELEDGEREREMARKSKAFSAFSSSLSDGVMSELEGSEVATNTALSGTTTGVANQSDAADDHQRHGPAHSTDLDGGALRDAFIPNWTSREFEGFVAEIAELTDLLAEREDAVNRKLDVYKAVWRHVLDVERRFWPDVGVGVGGGVAD
ncbi:hypothetical protein A1O7_01660 [Cladophialophora yegresii CBS 114405]|uniref:Thiaminase-2/PQQC domain-containing protein n=1 Tax=Cladophialophora yegresii CBS 114405 TaxID=1182544 RepID=W9X4B8_9EURO|nr:uncharacterized protein A1O7_01660 [Cladophialophora yegresii CBS 114405]EXJ65319.1 hypothetical protein A1O7_01660 [Cladophialophora yegresii CBS 114405]